MPKPAACASCGKRLSKKQWYYRNGQHYCKQHCWDTAKEKAQAEAAKKAAEAPAPAAAAAAPKAADTPAPEAPAKSKS